MKPINFKHWHFWIKALILATVLFSVHATIDHAFWHYGKHPFWVNPYYGMPFLKLPLPDKIDYPTASGGGGLAGKGIAAPEASLTVNDLALQYNSANSDGSRLEIIINGKQVEHHLLDWMLIPIARFADSEYHGMVSLFGPQTDTVRYDISFHEAFQNTLLGVRLLHSDIFFIDLNEFWKVPHYDGEVIIAPEERIPGGTSHWNEPAAALSNVFFPREEKEFQSWIKVDLETNYTFDVVNNQLVFEGLPYYYFWKADWEAYSAQFNEYVGKADSAAAAGNIELHNVYVEMANNLKPEVLEVKSLTDGMKAAYHHLDAYNPYAYDATLATYQYAAFFRYVKNNFPDTWNNFIASIEEVQIEPQVFTPTVWWYNGDPEILNGFGKKRLDPDVLGPVQTYPNPTTGVFNFSLKNSYTGQLQIEVYDAAGVQLMRYHTQGNTANYKDEIDISAYPAGIYFVRVSVDRYVSVGKIIKQ